MNCLGDAAVKLGQRRAPAAAGAGKATKVSDMRTTSAKIAAGTSLGESAAYLEKREENMNKWAPNTVAGAVTKIAAYRQRTDKAAAAEEAQAEAEDTLLAAAEEMCLAILLDD